jgi:hypothetical protein
VLRGTAQTLVRHCGGTPSDARILPHPEG